MPTITIEFDSERVQNLFKALSNAVSPDGFADTMKEIGEDLLYSTRQRMIQGIAPDGSQWTPLSAVTLAIRRKRGRSGAKPLIDTGTLKTALNYRILPAGVSIGTNRQGAHAHQFGTNRAGRGRKVTIPPRPFLGISDEDTEAIERTIVRAIEGGIE
ncbi:MAG: phage virion morphogenesis protein [Betaproteobacteria bacterium]|nr:phage virion morphogenesis protein [Betaproteobacteria bacterium]